MHSRVIRSQCQAQVSLVEIQQMAQLFRPATDVLDWVIDVCHTQGRRRLRGELHKSHSALVRDDMLAKIGLRFNHRMQQRRIEPIPCRVKGDGAADFLFGVP